MKARPVWLAALAMIAPAAILSAQATGPAPTSASAAEQRTAGKYHNFRVAIYIPVMIVNRFAEPGRLEREWAAISSQLRVDKVYIESERDRIVASDELLETVKKFFLERGVQVAGGITFSDGGGGQFRSFCYTDPADRDFVKKVSELTARHFDEIILDDFFFVTTKYPSDIAAKGNRTWTEFRLDLMNHAGRDLVVTPAKTVNPRAKITIKYPNWYEHFAGSGFDLQEGPRIYDGIYTGTETRDPNATDQFLQQYESYEIIRYFDHIAPGRNGGGWVDTFSLRYVDRYAEQLWDTMFAKAREMTLFNWAALLEPVQAGDRTWQGRRTSFNYDAMAAYRPAPTGSPADPSAPGMARVAGYSLDQVDGFLGKLGRPIGIKSYRPPHATGDDFLHNYLGMVGIPIELYPTFPADADVVLLTESARADPQLVDRIKQQLLAGKSVVVTATLYRALQGHGIEDIVELEPTEKRILADGYSTGFGAGQRASLKNEVTGAPAILFPEIRFLTNDAWALVSAMSDGLGFPLLLMDRYGKGGAFYVWNIPDNFHHLYRLPPPVTTAIKDVVMRGFPVRLDGPSGVSLFAYDNRTLVVESFRDEAADVKIGALGAAKTLRNLVDGSAIAGTAPPSPAGPRDHAEPRTSFLVHLAPHSYGVFALEP